MITSYTPSRKCFYCVEYEADGGKQKIWFDDRKNAEGFTESNGGSLKTRIFTKEEDIKAAEQWVEESGGHENYIIEKITLSYIKYELGWTDSMIRKLLPEPELKTNPVYRSAAPVKLWPKKTVLKAMQTEEYAVLREKADKRSAAAKKAVEQRIEVSEKEIDEFLATVTVRKLPAEKIMQLAYRSQEDLAYERGNFDFGAYEDIPAGVIERWSVNFIRHEMLDYDLALYSLVCGKAGATRLYSRLKTGIIKIIAETYPEFTAECKRQANE